MARQSTDPKREMDVYLERRELDRLAAYLKQQDQETIAELRTMATSYFAYYAVCREAGFNSDQAMALVVAMQNTFLVNAQERNRE